MWQVYCCEVGRVFFRMVKRHVKTTVFWDVPLYSLFERHKHFRTGCTYNIFYKEAVSSRFL
jgi:hypothetical protein